MADCHLARQTVLSLLLNSLFYVPPPEGLFTIIRPIAMSKRVTFFLSALLIICLFLPKTGHTQTETNTAIAKAANGLALRGIGPALMGGRIADIAVSPHDASTWYVAAGSGNLWKTTNRGITWTAVFDKQASYSIGTVTIDPNQPSSAMR